MWSWFWKWKTLALPIWRLELITNKIKQKYLKQRDLAPFKKNKLGNSTYDLILENQNRTRKHLASSVQNLKDSWNVQALFMSYLSLELETTDLNEILKRCTFSLRSSTVGDCREGLLFISNRPPVIHALSWGERRLHYEWHGARYKHSCVLTWFHWPPNKLVSGALISFYRPQG